MNTSFCKNCGAPLQPGYQVCPSCGTQVAAPQQVPPMNNQPMGVPQQPYQQPMGPQPMPGAYPAQSDNSMVFGIISIVLALVAFFVIGLAAFIGLPLAATGMSQAKATNNSSGRTVCIIGLVLNIIDVIFLIIGIAMKL